MRIGLKRGVYEKRLHALANADEDTPSHWRLYSSWCDWARHVKPTLHLNGRGWTIKAGERELTCEDGEVMGDPWLYFWLTGDVTRVLPQRETDLSELADALDAQPLEALR